MSHELFFEIGTEEIPSRFLPPAIADLRRLLEERLTAGRLAYGEIYTTATPRRLVAHVRDLAEAQEDEHIEKLGPAWAAAFDGEGKPSKSAEGFARGQGIDPSELVKIESDKGTRAGVRKVIAGRPTKEIAPEIITAVLAAIPWQKSMRWGDETTRFVRPIQWIVAVLDGKKIVLEYAGVKSGNKSYGHRFHAPKAFTVAGFEDYKKKTGNAFVEIDFQARKQRIADGLQKIASEIGGKLVEDEELLDLVTGLAEWPVLYRGTIPDQFMSLPRPVLITPMREHQKYFCFEDEAGDLLPYFVAIGGIEAKDRAVVTAGYERVLRARLADARHFYEKDVQKPLGDLSERLDGMLFHRKLGSYKEKVLRDQQICDWLAERVAPAKKDLALRALWLVKADLLTQMVGEFPELQGQMGREYARKQDEAPEVAEAIFEHYLPRFAGDILPTGDIGALCSLSDKMDSIVACQGVGLAPTGAGDPYALRRQALGVLQILLDKKWHIDLREFAVCAAKASGEKTKAVAEELASQTMEFFLGRCSNWLKQKGIPAEVVDSVLSVRFVDMVEVVARVEAVASFAEGKDWPAFTTAFKRVANIIGGLAAGPVDESRMTEDAERALWTAYLAVRGEVDRLVKEKNYRKALETIAGIRPQVDAFFDSTLVMHQDPSIKENRLFLLANIATLFSEIADFKKI